MGRRRVEEGDEGLDRVEALEIMRQQLVRQFQLSAVAEDGRAVRTTMSATSSATPAAVAAVERGIGSIFAVGSIAGAANRPSRGAPSAAMRQRAPHCRGARILLHCKKGKIDNLRLNGPTITPAHLEA